MCFRRQVANSAKAGEPGSALAALQGIVWAVAAAVPPGGAAEEEGWRRVFVQVQALLLLLSPGFRQVRAARTAFQNQANLRISREIS
eukprot:COSAG05_NODE_49_length_24373_cov_16.162561_4_plen_87_part_00